MLIELFKKRKTRWVFYLIQTFYSSFKMGNAALCLKKLRLLLHTLLSCVRVGRFFYEQLLSTCLSKDYSFVLTCQITSMLCYVFCSCSSNYTIISLNIHNVSYKKLHVNQYDMLCKVPYRIHNFLFYYWAWKKVESTFIFS